MSNYTQLASSTLTWIIPILFGSGQGVLRRRVVIESFQFTFGFLVLDLDKIKSLSDTIQGQLVVELVFGATFIFTCAVVLNAFARVFHFGQAKRRR